MNITIVGNIVLVKGWHTVYWLVWDWDCICQLKIKEDNPVAASVNGLRVCVCGYFEMYFPLLFDLAALKSIIGQLMYM